jgi:RimJ/RimL family protein N-acetyltransferase
VHPDDAAAQVAFNLSMDSDLLDQRFPLVGLLRETEWATRKSTAGFDAQEFHYQMEALDSGELVGGIATHHCDARVGLVSYGLWVFDAHRGKGYASEAVCLVLRYYFQELRYQKANIEVYEINAGSRALHESLGFTLEGRRRRSVYRRGEYSDMLQYGITVEEFRARHAEYWLPNRDDDPDSAG